MSDSFKDDLKLPPEQQAIRDKCFHPSGKFIEFPKEDVETSITARFEKIVGRFPDRLAVKMRNRTLTYQELNHAANRLAHAILAQRGEMPDAIALMLEHDSPLIVAIVGVLKAGKICVVRDHRFPKREVLSCWGLAAVPHYDSKNLSLARDTLRQCGCVNIDELDSGTFCDTRIVNLARSLLSCLHIGSTGQPKVSFRITEICARWSALCMAFIFVLTTG